MMTYSGRTSGRSLKSWTTGLFAILTLAAALPAIAGNPSTDLPSAKLRAGTTGKPLKVFILAGQSNMQPQVRYQQLANGLKDSPETKYLHDKLFDENGVIRTTENVYLAQIGTREFWRPKEQQEKLGPMGTRSEGGYPLTGSHFYDEQRPPNSGPETTFGVIMHEKLQQPILLIKTAWGGKSLYEDFRPPTGKDWEPPKDSPDHPDNRPAPHPIPKNFTLPEDFEKPKGSKNLQIFQGFPLDEMHGVSPIYVNFPYAKTKEGDLTDIPLKAGDVIIGLNGEGLHGDAMTRWRDMWFNRVREEDWMLRITLLRDGEIKTVTVDVARSLEGGRAGLPAYMGAKNAAQEKLLKEGGEYYLKMLETIRYVLADPGKFHPAYDPEQGYEIAGFVWFQGYNDYVSSVTYPNGDKPRGYEKYSWLLAQLIRSVRKELEVPKMPVVVGVFGQVPEAHPFAQAQTAVAGYDEFKGNVVAVQTREFNDKRIGEIGAKYDRVMNYNGGDPNHPYAKLQAKVREMRKIQDRSERKKAEMMAAGLTAEEADYMVNNECNQGFHYFGSPKFFMRAGEAFAKALSGLIKK